MEYENIKLEIEGRIGLVTVSRPKVLNALNMDTIRELSHVFEHLDKAPEVGGVILTGDGDKAFVAGADISRMMKMDVRRAREFAEAGQKALSGIENMGKPVIAAVNGYALGGGTELAMACDIILASEKARFGQPEVKLGVIPGFGGTQRMARRLGINLAKEIILSGETIDAGRALSIGLVNALHPPALLMDEAKKLMKSILANGPVALAQAKHAINRGADLDFNTAMLIELDAFALCFSTDDQKEGMRAFIDKREPKFKGK